MFFPFDIGEIQGAIELVQRIIEIGWSNVHNAHQQYTEFKQDVEDLERQLVTLQAAIIESRTRTDALLAPRQSSDLPRQLDAVFGNFRQTLENCQRLLESQSRYGTPSNPFSNIQWYLLVKDEVSMHRDRIAVLKSKLSFVLQSLEIETKNGQTVLMLECTNLVIERINQLDDRIARMLRWPQPLDPPRRIEVPQSLENFLVSVTTARHGSLASIPVYQAVEEIIFYLDRATKWHERRQLIQQRRESQFVNVLRAYWLLTVTKESDEYRAATSTVTVTQFEQQFPRLGMTVRRFFSKFEDRIFETHAELVSLGEPPPPIPRLQAVLEQEQNAWQEYNEWKPRLEEEDDNPRRGERVAVCRLQNTSTVTGQVLEIYRPEENQPHLTLITCGPGRPDRVYHVDLKSLHLAPASDAATLRGRYSVTLSPARGRSHGGARWAFQEPEDLFEFQEWMTGYKVVDDFPITVVTSQFANALPLGGERRIVTGRVQVWSSTRRSTGSQLPEEFLDDDSTSRKRRSFSSRIVSPYAPVLAPLASLSRLTLSPTTRNSTSSRSIPIDAQPISPTQSGAPSSPLTRTWSGRSSSTSRSSITSAGSPTRRPANIIRVDRQGNMGVVLDQPDPARLVIFLPPTEAQRQGVAGSSSSLLVVDINQYIRINPSLCDCQQDRIATTEGQGQVQGHSRARSLDTIVVSQGQVIPSRQASPAQPQSQCRKVILEVVGVSGITARETDSGIQGPWNLASAGRYQNGEGMVEVRRLKKVGLEFVGVEERKRFVEYFTALWRLYLNDWNAARR